MIERTLTATRYLQPFRQGGSVPALVETDDGELYVLKFHAAAQGRRALVAEMLAGEIGRALGLRVPELALVQVEPNFGIGEAHREISEMLNASSGLNLGLRFLPDSLEYSPLLKPSPAPEEAAAIVWFDAFVTNVDRTPRNVNILLQKRQLWLIDHGASLYFHHSSAWYSEDVVLQRASTPFALVKDHVLLRFAGPLPEADAQLRPLLNPEVVAGIVNLVPDSWLLDAVRPAVMRAAYGRWLTERLAVSHVFVDEAENARARASFEYTVLRVAPSIEREEFVNVGVLLFCQQLHFLGAQIALDASRVLALDPQADVAGIRAQLDLIPRIVAGGREAGEIGLLSLGERFRWLASPRNTIVRPSTVHPGLCTDPQAALDLIFARLVPAQGRS